MTDKPSIRPRIEQSLTIAHKACCINARIEDACTRNDGTIDRAKVERAVIIEGQRIVIERDM